MKTFLIGYVTRGGKPPKRIPFGYWDSLYEQATAACARGEIDDGWLRLIDEETATLATERS